MTQKRFFVYLITNIQDGTLYVGKTVRIETRWAEHQRHARLSSDCRPLYAALRSQGPESFEFRILESHSTEEEAYVAEEFFISHFRSAGAQLYNLHRGGRGGKAGRVPWNKGGHLSPEHRSKLSRIHKERLVQQEKLHLARIAELL